MELSNSDRTSDNDFNIFKKKVKASFGLDLEAYKRPQMERRLRANMEKVGVDSFAKYFLLLEKDEKLLNDFFDRVTINVTELFRNPEQFEVLRTKVLPELLASNKNLNIWSAGCSLGAEAYTLAILAKEASPSGKHSILATDIDDRMLARARAGIFSDLEMKNVSKARQFKFFKTVENGFEATNEIKSIITFRKHDLLKDRFSAGYDLIVCRNVVIYFTDETKYDLYRKFFNSLRPGGYLFVGGTERITDYSDIGFENSFPFFYRKPNKH
ncbi:MAG: protein-glutamate O-methyltransferase CheR [Armatimonadota bacterium]